MSNQKNEVNPLLCPGAELVERMKSVRQESPAGTVVAITNEELDTIILLETANRPCTTPTKSE